MKTDTRARGIVTFLGLFSIALGAAEIFAPKEVARAGGIMNRSSALPAYGARELIAGLGLLLTSWPGFWLWSRVVGDIIDLGTLKPYDARRRQRAALAVAGVTALDVVSAVRH